MDSSNGWRCTPTTHHRAFLTEKLAAFPLTHRSLSTGSPRWSSSILNVTGHPILFDKAAAPKPRFALSSRLMWTSNCSSVLTGGPSHLCITTKSPKTFHSSLRVSLKRWTDISQAQSRKGDVGFRYRVQDVGCGGWTLGMLDWDSVWVVGGDWAWWVGLSDAK